MNDEEPIPDDGGNIPYKPPNTDLDNVPLNIAKAVVFSVLLLAYIFLIYYYPVKQRYVKKGSNYLLLLLGIQVLNFGFILEKSKLSASVKRALYLIYRFIEIDCSFHLILLIFFSMVCSGIELYTTL